MYSSFLGKEIDEKALHTCYFFYGEEPFLAEEFIDDLKRTLISPEDQDYNIEKCNLEDQSWMEIMDLARTIPFFFSSWRVITVGLPVGKGERLSSTEEKILKDYFSSPSDQTVLVVIYPGKLRRSAPIFRLFSSFPSSLVHVKELRPLKGRNLFLWMDKKLSLLGKRATQDTTARLAELAGNNLARLNNELEKISVFVGEKKIIELDDVNAVSGWIKSFHEWEIVDNLEKADFEKSLIVLDNLFRESIRPEFILGLMAKYFRDIFLAKLWLMEKEKDKKTIFKELRPQIQERFGQFYTTKFRSFFSVVENMPLRDLNDLLSKLKEIDLKVKTTDMNPQTLLEGFLFHYCQLRKDARITSKERD
ncbi:MAG: DNA polymerase III subunit delta [Candidatus Aminicenantes bacterium]|nr:MAG: DNA polymerase III subunit delta [Candidatus Aminicenantes bacterium]